MFKWIKTIILNEGNEFNADKARELSNMHIKGFNKKQEKYKNRLCRGIYVTARCGIRSIYTDEVGDEDWITVDYLLSLKEYFENKGFDVKMYEKDYPSYLKISW